MFRIDNPWLAQRLVGYALIAPWLVGLILFVLIPVLGSFYISFTNWDIVREPVFVGLDNYRYMAGDRLFKTALANTVYIAIGSVPLSLFVALGLAVLINRGIPGTSLARAIFYMPSVVSLVAMGFLWQWMLEPSVGIVNYLLSLIGISGPSWLGSVAWSKPSIILVGLFYVGPQMVIFQAGLKSISPHLYEAAEIDGANPWMKFWNITVPGLSPTILFNTITMVIHAFQIFALVVVMFSGPSQPPHGPLNSALVFSLYIYEVAFGQLRMGYASAMAWVLFAIVMGLTVLQLRFSRWVFYGREEER